MKSIEVLWSRFISKESRKLFVLSLAVGVLAGLASVLLHRLIYWIKHILTFWFPDTDYYVLYLVYPGIGMLLAYLFVRLVVKDNIGHGVTKVLVAVSKNESQIKPHNTWSSLFSSALTIGFGGSVGAEAPIVYTGAAIGSNIARLFRLSYKSMTILLGCGASAAVAATFKAPLAGVLFTLEILLFNISMSSMIPLLAATVSATVVSYLFLGDSTPFACTVTPFVMKNIPWYLILGLFCGLCSVYFTRMTLKLEDIIGKVRNPLCRWAGCAVLLGLLIYLFPPLYGEGYDSLGVLLNGGMIEFEEDTVLTSMLRSRWGIPAFFALILLLKVFSMTLTNAGGGVGGTFGPTLFIGAVSGFVLARTLNLLLVSSGISLPEQNFVLVGMAGLMAGVMQAPMTAIFLIAEISGGYVLFMPLIIVSAVAFGTTRIFERYSIYTKRIAKSGELLTHDSDQAVLTLLRTRDFIETDYSPVKIDATLGEFVKVISSSVRNTFPVIDSRGRYQGYVGLEAVRKMMFSTDKYDSMHVYNFMSSSPFYVKEDESMESVMNKFELSGRGHLPVVDHDRRYLGFICKAHLLSSYRAELKEISGE